MPCETRTRALVVGLAALVVLLWAPSASFAASASTELLAPGAGYASPEGSPAVRDVQRLLRRLGDAPGPIDGLYGPLTAAAVQRFQEAHAVAVDGIVGPQTMGRLTAERGRLRTAKLERKSPAGESPAESVEQPARSPQPAGGAEPARRGGGPEPARAGPKASPEAAPEPSSEPSPLIAAIVGGLALVLLLVVLWRLARRQRQRPRGQPATGSRLGLVCAALLAAYVVGAATGAVFATHATSDDHPEPSTATVEPRSR